MLPPSAPAREDVETVEQDAIRRRIAAAMKVKRESRSHMFDSHLPRSWFRVLRGVISYALLFSDVPRSGIGVRSLAPLATMLEPDKIQSFGSTSYYVAQLFKNETDTETADPPSIKVWSYKFDTTSIVWRAFAEYLDLSVFPDCILYRSECPSKTLSNAVVFHMIDALPIALARRRQHPLDEGRPVVVALRTKSKYYDKVHHYVLPGIFLRPNSRTHQAFYYSPQVLTSSGSLICATQSAIDPLPYFCLQKWTNFRRSCPEGNTECQSIETVARHTLKRLRELQAQYPDAAVDLTLLESYETMHTIRGGVCYAGRQNVDVTTIFRVLNCSEQVSAAANATEHCETILVHDYRYEAVSIMTDVVQWYTIVASLRAVGQGYFFLRVFTLLLACYATRAAEEKYKDTSLWTRWRAAWLLFIRVPSQCIIHGSTFPIVCYVCAHLIDAPFSYESVGDQLTTENGSFTFTVWDFCLIAAVQMRSLWLLVLFAQCVMALLTRHHDPDWTPAHGILGVRSLAVSVLASLTIFGQFRSLSLRNTDVISIHELAHPSTIAQVIHHHNMQQRGTRAFILEGVYIDIKLILCILFLAVVLVALQSPVQDSKNSKRPSIVRKSLVAMADQEASAPAPAPQWSTWPQTGDARDTLRFLQLHMESVSARHPDVDAIVALFNLVMMSDPLVFCALKLVGRGKPLAFYETKASATSSSSLSSPHGQMIVLLPPVITDKCFLSDELDLLLQVNSADLAWSDLIHCG